MKKIITTLALSLVLATSLVSCTPEPINTSKKISTEDPVIELNLALGEWRSIKQGNEQKILIVEKTGMTIVYDYNTFTEIQNQKEEDYPRESIIDSSSIMTSEEVNDGFEQITYSLELDSVQNLLTLKALTEKFTDSSKSTSISSKTEYEVFTPNLTPLPTK